MPYRSDSPPGGTSCRSAGSFSPGRPAFSACGTCLTRCPDAPRRSSCGRCRREAVAESSASDVATARQTLSRYLDLLELVFVIKRIPAWSSNLTTRAISTPKLILTDSGLGGRLTGMSEERAKDPTAPVGPLLENYAISEVACQLTWTDEPVQLFHYRDRDKVEVDMVLEHAACATWPAASTTGPGQESSSTPASSNCPFGDRLAALPISALWTTAS